MTERNSLKRRRETSCFRPLSWGLSFNENAVELAREFARFSSPFLGTFFQFLWETWKELLAFRFRPLSWGLSFNNTLIGRMGTPRKKFSSPFLGTFFQ